MMQIMHMASSKAGFTHHTLALSGFSVNQSHKEQTEYYKEKYY